MGTTMHFTTENLLNGLVLLSLTILLIGLLLRRLKQPYFIAYIISGILLGPAVMGVITNRVFIEGLGELGIILLMFFIGAEIKLPDLSRNVKRLLVGAFSQLLLSFFLVALLGYYRQWSFPVIILFTFIISLSSSAIIFQYLSKNKEINSSLGMLTTGVLLIQDIMVVPMLLVLNLMGKGELQTVQLIKAVAGSILMILFLRAAIRKKLFRIPFHADIIKDHDVQVFVSLLACFGMAWLSQSFGLSAAMGAFVAGILIGQDQSTHWLVHALVPFRVFFLSLFFIAVGLQLNIDFFFKNIGIILVLGMMVLFINSLINALAFRMLKVSWKDSWYAGALLSQIGEFSFVLNMKAYELHIVNDYIYQLALSVVSLTMLLTTIWIGTMRTFIFRASKIIPVGCL